MAMATGIAGAALSDVADIAGTTLSALGSHQQYKQAKANAKMRSELMKYNARVEELEAKRIDKETMGNVVRSREAANTLKSSQRAMLGKSGAAITSGSPMAIMGESASMEEQAIRDVHVSGYQEAQSHRNKAEMYRYESRLARAMAPSSTSLGLDIAGQWVGYAGRLGSRLSSFTGGGK